MVKQNKKQGMYRGYYSFDSLMTNVYYLAKWNPYEAMIWLDEARYFVEQPHQARRYNRIVDNINNFLDSVEKKKYCIVKELWNGQVPERGNYIFDFGEEGFTNA